MAWGKVDVEEQRMRFVIAASRKEKPFQRLCQEFDISRPTGYEWRRRYEAGGSQAVVEKSRRPQHSPQRTSQPIEQRVVGLRQQRPDWEPASCRCFWNKKGSYCRSSPSTVFCYAISWCEAKIDIELRYNVLRGQHRMSCGRWTSKALWAGKHRSGPYRCSMITADMLWSCMVPGQHA